MVWLANDEAHDEARVAGGAAEVHQAALGQQDDLLAIREHHVIDLRLDFDPLAGALERGDVDLVVEVTDVADDGLVFHLGHVLEGDHRLVAGRGDEDVGFVGCVIHGHHFVAFHGRLQCADRVDLGDPHLCRQRTQGLCRTLTDIAIARHYRDLAGDHDVGGTLDAVDQALTAAVEVVELALGHGIVDVDGAEQQRAGSRHLLEAVDAGGGLFGHPDDLCGLAAVPGRVDRQLRLDRVEQLGFFFAVRVG